MSGDLRMVLEEPTPNDEEHIRRQLGQWNISITGLTDYAPANFVLRDGEDKIWGAALAYVWGEWLHVDVLWLRDEIRGLGWGTRLLEAVHATGREHGAGAAWLDTFSWQARPFYERFGYELVFEVPGFPAGHSRFFMRKAPL
jgi:GNAT superfamily N-acetyltransferase